MVEAGWNQTLVISVLERRLQKNWGCIPSRWGKSPRGIVIATSSSQWIQTATNYFKPQEENLLHEMTHLITSPSHTCSPVYTCQVMHRETTVTFNVKSILFSASYLLGTFFITILILLLTGWFYNQPLVEIQWIWFKTSGLYLFFLLSVFAWCELCFRAQREITNRFRSVVISTLFRGSVYVACRLPQ